MARHGDHGVTGCSFNALGTLASVTEQCSINNKQAFSTSRANAASINPAPNLPHSLDTKLV
jgi:hypothetical protein